MSTSERIRAAVERLRRGGIVAFPTETVYGLGADAMNAAAIARVFSLKGRPASNPLILHVAGAAAARGLVRRWPDAAERLAAALWPGPLTIVLPKADRVLPAITGGGDNVAVRAPDHPLALALLGEFGGPLVGPSANPSGRVSPTAAAHVSASFRPQDVLVLDGGPCRAGIESTVLSLAGAPRILRPGLITASQIEAVLGYPATPWQPGRGQESPAGGRPGMAEPLPAPGQLPSHYAPATPAVLFDSADWPRILSRTATTAILTHSGRTAPPPHVVLPLPGAAAAYAARLYAALREADALMPSLIAVERPPTGSADAELWVAILDRLSRAVARTDGPRNLLS
ncbi:MAG: threonylcarbamoyl-AMP synthase [Phycisphaerales bacterium]|nr:threonylcarbamoyl-AMP synthase [Phycisphaerales bacterium]